MTPEGRVKKLISDYLRRVDGLWYNMPVPGGYGVSTLDYLGCYCGKFFAIEAKATPRQKPTDRQLATIEDIEHAGGKCFVINNDGLSEFKAWIEEVKNASGNPGSETAIAQDGR